jgi:hypothetical protein
MKGGGKTPKSADKLELISTNAGLIFTAEVPFDRPAAKNGDWPWMPPHFHCRPEP